MFHDSPSGESEKLKQGEGETPGPMKSAHGKNSETPVSASLSIFSSVATPRGTGGRTSSTGVTAGAGGDPAPVQALIGSDSVGVEAAGADSVGVAGAGGAKIVWLL